MKRKIKTADQIFPEWKILVYRGVRGAIGAGLAQAFLIPMDLNNPEAWLRLAGVSFLAGFIPALGKFLRDYLDSRFGYGEKSIIAKTMPI